jgi:hypothetical protein
MKRATELTLFTLTVSILTLLALHGAAKMRVSLDATAADTAKTITIIQEGSESFPTIEYVSDAELDAEIAK